MKQSTKSVVAIRLPNLDNVLPYISKLNSVGEIVPRVTDLIISAFSVTHRECLYDVINSSRYSHAIAEALYEIETCFEHIRVALIGYESAAIEKVTYRHTGEILITLNQEK